MIDLHQLASLHQERFVELPLDCGEASSPGISDGDEWRDWSRLETTGPQLRIEDYLARIGPDGKSILHVGIGASGLAKRFAATASRVLGTTISAAEVEKAAMLALPNYRAVLHNKYSGDNEAVPGRFDAIVDDGPTTFCCCLTHFARLLEFYASKLSPGGQVIIDRVGLGWTLQVAEANPRWGFSFDDLAATAPLAQLSAFRMTDDIYVLARHRPSGPTFASTARYWRRRAASKLSRVRSAVLPR